MGVLFMKIATKFGFLHYSGTYVYMTYFLDRLELYSNRCRNDTPINRNRFRLNDRGMKDTIRRLLQTCTFLDHILQISYFNNLQKI